MGSIKITEGLLDKLIKLSTGAYLPASSLRGQFFKNMISERILILKTNGSRKSYRAADEKSLRNYVANTLNIEDLEAYRDMMFKDEVDRAEQVQLTGDSKMKHQRTFFGFLVNSYDSIEATLNGKPISIAPEDGTFLFIYDFRQFKIPSDVIVVGVENAENFRHIRRQKSLFISSLLKTPSDTSKILFVSRYPQQQSHDLILWLKSIPNKYIHFGDLDLAGVHIYLTEYYNHLGLRSSFLIPDDYENRIANGSLERYTAQYPFFKNMKVLDSRVQPLLDCIHKYHKGYDQEGYIL